MMPESKNMIDDKTVDDAKVVPESSEQANPPTGDSPTATLHVLLRGGIVVEHDLIKDEIKIGKSTNNDIVLPDPTVSGTHALITFINDEHILTDLGSRNGTLLNEVKLVEPAALCHGDLIKIGHCSITYRAEGAEVTLSIPAIQLWGGNVPAPPPPPPAPDLYPQNEESLSYLLRKAGLIVQSDIDRLTADKTKSLVPAILDENIVSSTQLRDLMSRSFNIQPVDLKTMDIAGSVLSSFPQQFWRKKMICPVIGPASDKSLLAIVDPIDKESVEKVEKETGNSLGVRLTTREEITVKLDEYYVPRLVGIFPDGDKIDFPLDRPDIEIGKAPHNKLVLSDPAISSTHAVILARDNNFGIVDLGSSNGTYVNNARLGNEVQI